ncbi:MAG: hypothetical protein A2Z91_06770 [Deltaproteobacteria bacterium GWA2_38_16]|nr:MAG: hypothetical protein A2Z91_06770 [Deltaproteobacteria bacterium GWA2_38_16]OGQ03388.1 MAG: hypothetical protein A3D19_04640 [Deltaproteobacteria bacterium RIFCSPHIGHO2_02_FULL_38_15]OGQ34729.1 MAG: hypothetical protein A3A72_07500 [Deltaproteobacteria bacterium RIFCSPLOWO2_01_FULL_38_9]
MTLATTLFKNTSYLRAKRDLLLSLKKAKGDIKGVKKSTSDILAKASQEIGDLRGRPLFYSAIFSGLGNGPLAELIDGSIKYDFITGIGTHFFGHSDLDLVGCAVEAASKNVVMQGNLQSSPEVKDFLETILKEAGGRLQYGWLAPTGTDANENALKVIRHKKTPAHKIIAFKNCFHGRTLIMADITDQDAYRKGLYRYHDAFYIPFYDVTDSQSIQKSELALKEILSQHKAEISGFVFELVQGEGGFNSAPPEFFKRLMTICKENHIAVWVDEIQTVGRTGELFAFQKLGLEEYVDIVTAGKMLQNCVTLYTKEYNPEAGLLAGTFCGSTVSLAVGRRVIERLKEEKFFGKNGKLAQLEKWAVKGLEDLQKRVGEEKVSHIGAIGAMVSWQFLDGSLEKTKELILKAFEEGIMVFYCGRGPYKIRFLLPGGCLTQAQYEKGLSFIEKAIKKVTL